MHPLTEQEIQSRLLYRDACVLVIDKPAGLAVHVTGNDSISIDQSFKFIQFGLKNPPALAHRLDRDTSGCLVLGRHRQALNKLGDMFKEQHIEKTYIAIVAGRPAENSGVIDRPILKTGHGKRWRMVLDDAGQTAVTHYRVLASNGEVSALEFSPKTGRTHQIRLHAAYALGCPVLRDPFYAETQPEFPDEPMQLHAWKIQIPYYANKPAIAVEAPIPAAMQGWMARLTGAAL